MATRDISDAQVVRACTMISPLDWLMMSTGQPEKVCVRAMERAVSRGLIDYGTSIRFAWATSEGKALLEGGK